MNKRFDIRTIVILGMFSAIAFALVFVSRFTPAIAAGFLKYDPKDVIMVMAGFIYGPVAALAVSVVVSFIEMITISTTGWIGLIMNILSSGVFCCAASIVYKKKHTLKGAVLGLVLACILTTGVMLLWNYIVTPIHLGMPRPVVADMLIPVFLPFNLIKTVANSAFALMIYKPIVTALRKAKLINLSNSKNTVSNSKVIMLYITVALVILSCVLAVLVLNGII